MRNIKILLLTLALLPSLSFAQSAIPTNGGTTIIPSGSGRVMDASGNPVRSSLSRNESDNSLDKARAEIQAEALNQQRLAQEQLAVQQQQLALPNGSLRSPQETASDVVPQEAKTAQEQGFGSQQQSEEQKEAMRQYQLSNTPRQRGIVVPAPTLMNPVGKKAEYREWLQNWEYALSNLGVSPQKIRFEANRLNQEDFEAWASRQYRFRQGQEQSQFYIQVLKRPDGVAEQAE